MVYSYLLSASALAAMSLGAMLYTMAGQRDHGGRRADDDERRSAPEQFSARYRER
jgi:hypothetical protein